MNTLGFGKERGVSTGIAILIVAVIVAGSGFFLLSYGGGGGGDDVVLYHYWTAGVDKKAVNDLVDGFENEYPDTEVSNNPFTSYSSKFDLEVGSGTFDVGAHWFNRDYRQYAQNGKLANLTDFWQDGGLNQVFPDKISNLLEVNGKKYGVPLDMHWEGGVVLYNLQVFDELGLNIPQTWSEFQQTLQTIKEEGQEESPKIYPLALGTSGGKQAQDDLFTSVLAAVAGPDFYKGLAEGTESWTDPKVKETFRIIKGWAENDYFDPSWAGLQWDEALGNFRDGEDAMYFMGDWAAATLKDLGWQPGTDYRIDWVPTKPGVERMGIPDLEGLVIPSASSGNESAKDFLKYATTADAQRDFNDKKGSISPNTNVSIESYGDSLQVEMYNEVEDKEWALPIMWYMPFSVRTEYNTQISNLFSNPGQVDVDQICSALETARNQSG